MDTQTAIHGCIESLIQHMSRLPPRLRREMQHVVAQLKQLETLVIDELTSACAPACPGRDSSHAAPGSGPASVRSAPLASPASQTPPRDNRDPLLASHGECTTNSAPIEEHQGKRATAICAPIPSRASKPKRVAGGGRAAVSLSRPHEGSKGRDQQTSMSIRWTRGENDLKGRFVEKRSGNTSSKVWSGM